jgi:hypothetical protein
MFIERVSGLDKGMRNKVNDFSADKVFNENSDIARETDKSYNKDLGKLASNTDKEARDSHKSKGK